MARVGVRRLRGHGQHPADRAPDHRVRGQGGVAVGPRRPCAARPILARLLPAAGSDQDRLGTSLGRLARRGDADAPRGRVLARGALIGGAVVILATAIVAAGTPARTFSQDVAAQPPTEIAVDIDPATLPPVTVDPDVADVSRALAGPGAQELAVTLAENLEVEAQAVRSADKSPLHSVDFAGRLAEMEGQIDDAVATGTAVVAHYAFESLHLVLIPSEGQSGLSVGLEARGTVEEVTTGPAVTRRVGPPRHSRSPSC